MSKTSINHETNNTTVGYEWHEQIDKWRDKDREHNFNCQCHTCVKALRKRIVELEKKISQI